jgi:hypothetical protein
MFRYYRRILERIPFLIHSSLQIHVSSFSTSVDDASGVGQSPEAMKGGVPRGLPGTPDHITHNACRQLITMRLNWQSYYSTFMPSFLSVGTDLDKGRRYR